MKTKGRDQGNGDQGERPREWRPRGMQKMLDDGDSMGESVTGQKGGSKKELGKHRGG